MTPNPKRLRDIADRLDTIEAMRVEVLRELRELVWPNRQSVSLPAMDGVAADQSGPVEAAAPLPLTAEELGHGPWFTDGEVEYCSGCRQRRQTLELVQSQASPELHGGIEAPVSEPAAGEVEGGDGSPSGVTVDAVLTSPDTDGLNCPACGKYLGSAANIGRHRRFCKGRPVPTALAEPDDGKDPRVIDEHCRKCDQRFTWRPALVNHERSCRGVGAVAS